MKELFLSEDPLIKGLIILYIVSILVEVFYYLFFYSQAAKPEKKKKKSQRRKSYFPVSVIICARNEEENLLKHLPLILKQDYPDFEVIVVNDCSDDNTQLILNNFQMQYKNLKVTNIQKDPKFTHNKKLALTIGIKAASHEHLLFTDADCYPVSKKWIKKIAANYENDIDIVAGYGAYETKPGFLNKLIRFETVFTAMQYMGFAERNLPYMGVGRNLSYKKSLFFKNKGFASHAHLPSGDDDLFVSETATPLNTVIEASPESFTLSVPESRFIDWLRQRKRHFITGPRYKFKIKFLLSLEYLFRIIFNISALVLVFLSKLPILIVLLYFFVFIIKALIFKIITKRLKEKFLFIFSLFIEILVPYIYIYIHLINLLEKKKH